MSKSRDRVLDKALHMFAEQGYSSVGMRAIADELGIQAPSLYSHFPSKDAMLRAIVEPFIDHIQVLFMNLPDEPVSKQARREWLTEAVTMLKANSDQLQFASNDRSLATHPVLGPRFWDVRQQLVECMCRFGVHERDWAIGVTGAIIYAVLAPIDTPDVATIVRMAEAFIDAG